MQEQGHKEIDQGLLLAPFAAFLESPNVDNAEQALLELAEVAKTWNPDSIEVYTPVVSALGKSGVLNGSDFNLLPAICVPLLWRLCKSNPADYQSFIDSHPLDVLPETPTQKEVDPTPQADGPTRSDPLAPFTAFLENPNRDKAKQAVQQLAKVARGLNVDEIEAYAPVISALGKSGGLNGRRIMGLPPICVSLLWRLCTRNPADYQSFIDSCPHDALPETPTQQEAATNSLLDEPPVADELTSFASVLSSPHTDNPTEASLDLDKATERLSPASIEVSAPVAEAPQKTEILNGDGICVSNPADSQTIVDGSPPGSLVETPAPKELDSSPKSDEPTPVDELKVFASFLRSPNRTNARDALLDLAMATEALNPDSLEVYAPVIATLCKTGVLNGEGIKHLPPVCLPLLWRLCKGNPAEFQSFIDSQGWRRELGRLRSTWSNLRLEKVNHSALLEELQKVLETARSTDTVDPWTPVEQSRYLVEFAFDLSKPGQREVEALLWSTDTQPKILQKVAKILKSDSLQAEAKGELLSWALLTGDEFALDQLCLAFPVDSRDVLVKRLQIMKKPGLAIRVVVKTLSDGLPADVSLLKSTLEFVKPYWDLKAHVPELVVAFATSISAVLVALAEQGKLDLELLGLCLAFEDPEQTTERHLLERLSVNLPAADIIIPLLLERLPVEERVTQALAWLAAHRVTQEQLIKSLLSLGMTSVVSLGKLNSRARKKYVEFLVALAKRLLEQESRLLSDWCVAQRARLEMRLKTAWESVPDCFERLKRCWLDSDALAQRISLLEEQLGLKFALADFCPILYQDVRGEVPPQTGQDPLSFSYFQENWSSWTELPEPDFKSLDGWLKGDWGSDDLNSLAFSIIQAVIEGHCPPSSLPEVESFLGSLFKSRPQCVEFLNENASDAVKMLPFTVGSPKGASNSADLNQDLSRLLDTLQLLGKMRAEATTQVSEFPSKLRNQQARRLAPVLDNLEQLFLPYFQFRNALTDALGMEPAVAGLDLPVSEEAFGTRVRLWGDQVVELPSLRNDTMGIKFRDDAKAYWPAYASPRPTQ